MYDTIGLRLNAAVCNDECLENIEENYKTESGVLHTVGYLRNLRVAQYTSSI